MSLAEQVARLRELASMSTETRMLDILIINILDELVQVIDGLKHNEPPGPDSDEAGGPGNGRSPR